LCRKDITSRSDGSNVITDPEGDVPYDFIDILQGSLDVCQTSEPVNKGDLNSAADVSGDDRVTSLDFLMIPKAAAGHMEL